MTKKTHQNCEECLAALIPGATACAVCGWDGMNQGDYHSGPAGYSPIPPTPRPSTAVTLMKKPNGTNRRRSCWVNYFLAGPFMSEVLALSLVLEPLFRNRERNRVSDAKPTSTSGQKTYSCRALGDAPCLLSPGVESCTVNTSNTMPPAKGTSPINTHQALLSVS